MCPAIQREQKRSRQRSKEEGQGHECKRQPQGEHIPSESDWAVALSAKSGEQRHLHAIIANTGSSGCHKYSQYWEILFRNRGKPGKIAETEREIRRGQAREQARDSERNRSSRGQARERCKDCKEVSISGE
jgi:hypothetical protein